MQDLQNIDAGDLRFRIEIQEATSTRNAKGESVNAEPWTTITTRWASVVPASGQRFTASEQIRDSISHKIVIRHYAELTTTHRIKFGERIFNILSVLNENELNVRQTILATEVLP